MKYFVLAYKLIFNHMVLHIILILQMIFALLISGSLISMLLLIDFSANTMKPSLDSKYCYFSPLNQDAFEIVKIKNYKAPDMTDISKELTKVKNICYNKNLVVRSEPAAPNTDYVIFDLTVQENEVINGTYVPMLLGKWLDETEKENGILRVVTNSLQYSVGEEVILQSDINGSKVELRLKIVGIAKNPFPYIGTSGGGNELCSANIIDTWDKKQYDKNIQFGIVAAEDLEQIASFTCSNMTTQNCNIFFEDTITDEELEHNITILERYGSVSEAESIKHFDNISKKHIIKEHLPRMIFIFTASIAGLGVVSAINTSNNVKMLSLFCISGCTRRKLYGIIFAYVLIIGLLSLIPVYLMYLLAPFSNNLSSYFVMINWISFLLPFFLVWVFAAISFIFPYSVLKKKPLNQIRNE